MRDKIYNVIATVILITISIASLYGWFWVLSNYPLQLFYTLILLLLVGGITSYLVLDITANSILGGATLLILGFLFISGLSVVAVPLINFFFTGFQIAFFPYIPK